MANISLTTFVDFVAATGHPKLAIVQRAKEQQEDYDPSHDFYRRLRMGICDFHCSGQTDKRLLDRILDEVTDEKKINLYALCIAEYKKFLGRKTISVFPSSSAEWAHGGLTVRVNPELGLIINGSPHVVKLYFKAKELSKQKVEIIHFLMDHMLGAQHPGRTFSILEVQQGRLIEGRNIKPDLMPLLRAEAICFMSLFNEL